MPGARLLSHWFESNSLDSPQLALGVGDSQVLVDTVLKNRRQVAHAEAGLPLSGEVIHYLGGPFQLISAFRGRRTQTVKLLLHDDPGGVGAEPLKREEPDVTAEELLSQSLLPEFSQDVLFVNGRGSVISVRLVHLEAKWPVARLVDGPGVRGEHDECATKVEYRLGGVPDPSFVEDLEDDLSHTRIRLLDFVEENDALRHVADP